MIRRFFDSALWLLEKYPVNCPREFFAGWLLRCICKNGDENVSVKKRLIERILAFLELPQREIFEHDLCQFITAFYLTARKKGSIVLQGHINGQVDWQKTMTINMIENPGSLVTFAARPTRQILDSHVLSVLQQIAWELLQNLEYFAKLLQTDKYDSRIERLRSVSAENSGSLNRYYDEHTAWKLRQHPQGRLLAAEIKKWHYHCISDMHGHVDPGQKALLEKILPEMTAGMAENCFNENDLLEGISIIQSVQALVESGFVVEKCVLDFKKPSIALKRHRPDGLPPQRVLIAKNIDGFSEMDRTKAYRTIGNNPTGLQPDIIYQCSGDKEFYLLGDAKNYEKSDFGPALYAMLHYLLAFSEELKLPADFFNNGENFLKVSGSYKRIVLFFPEEKRTKIAEDHPIQIIFGSELEPLKAFFENAFHLASET